MPLVIVPPGISSFAELLSKSPQDPVYLLLDPVIQSDFFAERSLKALTVPEVLDLNSFSSLNLEAKHFAMNWYRRGRLADQLTFSGVNLGSLFFAEMTYFFIGVLKARHIATSLLERKKRFGAFCVADNGTYWTRIFLEAARTQGVAVKRFDLDGTKEERISSKQIKNSARLFLKKFLGFWQTPSYARLVPGGVLYSSSHKFVEPLWKEDPSEASYYLRPEYSVKLSQVIRKKYPRLSHILPFKKGDWTPYFKARTWVKKTHFPQLIAEHFSKDPYFTVEGMDLWPSIQGEFLERISGRVTSIAPTVSGIEKLLKTLQPRLIVVDEDVTPFNQALVESGKTQGIKSLQIQHGIMGPINHLVPIRTTRMLVPGEVSKERLLKWGAEKETVVVLGMPHYESQVPEKGRTNGKAADDETARAVHKDLGFSPETRILTLVTHFFHSEEKPDWIGTKDNPDYVRRIIQIAARSVQGVGNWKLVIKLHPREDKEWFTEKVLQAIGMLEEVRILKNYDVVRLVRASETVLCCLSTVYFDALMMDRPVFVFDDSSFRELSFMSEDFLDVATPEKTQARVRKILMDEGLRKERLKQQEFEKKGHFIDDNRRSTLRFWEIASSL